MGKVTNFTVNNICSGCGECCTDFLPMTEREFQKIKDYVKAHNIKSNDSAMVMVRDTIDITCPFRDRKKGTCAIYKVRPDMCKRFICSDTQEQVERRKDSFYNDPHKRTVCFRDEIFKQGVRVKFIAAINQLIEL